MAVLDRQTDTSARREVIRRELAWHEEEAHRRRRLDALLYDPPAFDRVVDASMEFLGGEPGDLVLDMACGEGKETLALAQRGLCVIASDLSFTQIERARRRIRTLLPGARVHFVQANAEELPFGAGSFRLIYGKAILHHLDLAFAATEIDRLLRQNGRAAFAEPMAHHPLFWLGRRLTPRLRTQDEHPLTFHDLRRLGRAFAYGEIGGAFLLAPLAFPLRLMPGGERLFRVIFCWLDRLDNWLFRHVGFLRDYAWYGLVNLRKE